MLATKKEKKRKTDKLTNGKTEEETRKKKQNTGTWLYIK